VFVSFLLVCQGEKKQLKKQKQLIAVLQARTITRQLAASSDASSPPDKQDKSQKHGHNFRDITDIATPRPPVKNNNTAISSFFRCFFSP
jgi:hypothetical protein